MNPDEILSAVKIGLLFFGLFFAEDLLRNNGTVDPVICIVGFVALAAILGWYNPMGLFIGIIFVCFFKGKQAIS